MNQNLSSDTFVNKIFLLWTLIAASFLSLNNTAATLSFHSDDDKNNIRIYHEERNENRIYEVNGKKFYWKDLSPNQKEKLTKIDAKINKVEARIKTKENKISKIAEELESKARIIEDEMRKFEQATIKVKKPLVNRRDLEQMMRKLENIVNINENVIRVNELDMQKLEEKIEAIDMTFANEIDPHIKELESVLVEIAATLN